MSIVLVAVDDGSRASVVVRQAQRLFGDAAHYLVIHVAADVPRWVVEPLEWRDIRDPAPTRHRDTRSAHADPPRGAHPTAEQVADRAAEVADRIVEAGGVDGEVLGDFGDPGDAILRAASRHGVDVIVVGATQRAWWSRLLDRSVPAALLRAAHCPVLIVPNDAVE